MAPKTDRTGKYPRHINPDKLPSYARFDPRGRGRWVYRRRVGKNVREVPIGGAGMTLADIHAAVERIEKESAPTFKHLSEIFQASVKWGKLSRRTQMDYVNCHKAICGRQTRSGVLLGDVRLEAWTPGAVRRYMDARARESASRAAHDVRYLKRVFSWAVAYEYVQTNPAKEIRLEGLETARKHYVQDSDYLACMIAAPYRIALAAHLAYLTGRRKGDLLAMRRSAVQAEGLALTEGKTGKQTLILWSDELGATVQLLEQEAGSSIYLIPARDGGKYSDSGFNTAWQRIRGAMKRAGAIPFQFNDLRAKHATDFDEAGGDATRNLQHSTAAVTQKHYLRKPKKVIPLR